MVSPATNWRRLNSGGVESTATAISIAAKASLVGSRIDVVVTDQGAGVNHAGLMSATAGSFTLDSSGQVIVDGGAIEALAVVDIKASDLMIRTDPDREEQARIEAIAGGMHIDVSGDFENYGARLQSYARSVLDEDAEGGFTLDVGGDFLNYSLSRSQLAILFAENDDLVIHVAGDAINDAGRLVGNKNIRIHSEGDFTNLTDISDFARRGQFVTTRRQGDALWYALYTQREQIYLTRVDYGQSRIPGQLAYVVANGDVDIQAKNFINHGGEIDANEGSFTLDAKSVVNEGLLQGSAWIERRCSYLGCSESGHSDVSLIGGLISASDSIDIQADDFLHNIGGRLYAVNDIDITAPEVFHAAVVVTDVIERNAGLKDLFHHDHAKFVRGDQGGSMVASNGVLTITARDRIELMGSELLGGRGVNTNIEPEVLRERFQQAPIFADDIGLLQNW